MKTYATITINGKTCKIPADRLQGIAFVASREYNKEAENEYDVSGNTGFYHGFTTMATEARCLYEFVRNNK